MSEKIKQTKVPRNAEAIIKGALRLSLTERVGLKKELELSIVNEVKEIQERAAEAVKIANGKS